MQFGLSIRNRRKRKLVYTVNPLPYSMLNFVLYFNELSEETTNKYIEKMCQNINCELSSKNRQLINLLVCKSHFFIIKKGDISSVSLREINRFGKFFSFFHEKYFKIYRKINSKKNELEINSISLSLYFCYYLRLPSTELRQNYVNEIIEKKIPFLKLCKKESLFLTEKVLEGKKGYAKNKGLSENIFSEFICILLKEPLIICGKPGSSKSLSVRLLLNAMKGENSNVEFFKQFPEVIPSFYQCSLTSTSENLENVFENAEKKLVKKDLNIISLIFMDEMGIADESENNPLKVLHSRLDNNTEKENEKDKIAFIGITNWTLDASKMNRTINIVVEEPDFGYIIETANEIVKAININFVNKYEKEINAICKTYLEYIQEQIDRNKEDYHGFRDFYYLIKYIFSNIQESEASNDILYIIIKGIYRNFGGFESSEEIFLNKFLNNYTNEAIIKQYNIINRIKDNIESTIDSRYLLLITDDEQVNEIILKYLLEGKDYEILSDEDFNKYDNENNAVLNLILKIEVLMKKEMTLILKNLEILYPSLYELFNKNFYEYGSGNKFVQISYENNHSLVSINEKFRIIITVPKEKLNLEEKPFLSRFEKQIFSFKKILIKEDLNYINKCYEFIIKIKEKLSYSGLDCIDYIFKDLLILIMCKYNEKEKNNKIYFLKEIVALFPQEIIYVLNEIFKKEKIIDGQTVNDIILFFGEHYKNNYNFKSFLSNTNSYKNIIYTYSDINKSLLDKNEKIENKFLRMEFKAENMKILDEKTIKDFFIYTQSSYKIDEEKIKTFFEINKYDIYIISINEELLFNDDKNFNFENLFLEIEKYINENKALLLYIISKKKFNKVEEKNKIKKNILQIFLLYNQIFIDNLYTIYQKNENIDDYWFNLVKKGNNILYNYKLMQSRILNNAFELIIYKIKNEIGNNIENVERIKQCLINKKDIFELIINKMKYLMNEKNISLSQIAVNKDEDLIKSFFYKTMKDISILLKDIINYLEDDLALSTILFSNLSSDREKKQLENDFKQILDKFDESKNYNGIKNIYFGFNLVGLFKDYKKLNFEISSQDKSNEKDFMKNIMEGIILNQNYQFEKKLNSYASNHEKKYLFNDYILYFISLVIEAKVLKDKRNEIFNFINLILKLCILKITNNINTNFDYLDNTEFIDIIIDNKGDLPKYFYKMCLFLDNNREFLSKILYSLNEFLEINPNFNDLFRKLYRKNIIKNNILFRIFETFLDSISNEFHFSIYFNNETKEKYIEFLQNNKERFRNILSLLLKDYSLSLLNIEIFLYIIKNEKKGRDSQLLNNTIKYMIEEKENNYNNYENQYAIYLNQNKIDFNDKIFK